MLQSNAAHSLHKCLKSFECEAISMLDHYHYPFKRSPTLMTCPGDLRRRQPSGIDWLDSARDTLVPGSGTHGCTAATSAFDCNSAGME